LWEILILDEFIFFSEMRGRMVMRWIDRLKIKMEDRNYRRRRRL